MNKPLVGAIITTYKRKPEMLNKAIKSVLNQTYENLELIVVDDSPSDFEYRGEVRTLCESYGKSITYIQHQVNKGACAARNTGINASKGDYIAFLDDDDEWLPEKIEKQLAKFTSDKIGIVYCSNYIIFQDSNMRKIEQRDSFVGSVFDKLIFDNFIGSTSFPLLSRKAVENAGMFDDEMPASQDWDLWLRIAKDYDVEYIKEPLVNYYFHCGEQITKSKVKKAMAFERLVNKNLKYLEEHRKAYAFRLLGIADFCARDELVKAYKLWFKAFFKYPFLPKKLFETCKTIGYCTIHPKRKRSF